MSKPNPSITANLLNTLLEMRGEHPGGDGNGGTPKVTPENPKVSASKAKPVPGRKTAGAGRMRSSPRGK